MIVEISGIKLDVDERSARTVESYKVGDRVKVLTKGYGESYKIHYGVIVGFAAFQQLPSIEVMYVSTDTYESEPLKFVTLNDKTDNVEIAPLSEAEVVLMSRDDVLDRLDREIRKRRTALEDIEQKRAFFVRQFGALFEDVEVDGLEAEVLD